MEERTRMLPMDIVYIYIYNCGNARIIHAVSRKDKEIILREIMQGKEGHTL
jgi:hypothetical protein